MKRKILNYHILIEPDKQTGTGESCFTAFVPILGIATDGKTVEETLNSAKDLIQFHLESLTEEGEEIPVEQQESSFITRTSVYSPKGAILAI
jgi:predicted RNase H-like HicB family nuclease